MREGWEIKRLGEVTTKIGSGATPLGGEAAYKKEGIALIRSMNVYDSGFVEDGLAKIDLDQADKLSNVVVEKGDVLLNITGASVARCTVVPEECLPARVNQHVSIIRTQPHVLLPKYLQYLLISPEYKQQLVAVGEAGATRQAITKAQLLEFEIAFPKSLAEQQQIVAILDKAFEGIAKAKANAEQNLKNARELFESYLEGVFAAKGEGWEEKRLTEIAIEFGRGKSKHRPRGDESLLGGKYPLIQTGDVSNSTHWIDSYSQTYNEKGLAQSKLWPKGTVCIAIVGANVGESGILGFESCFPDSVIGIIVNPANANNEFVEYMLQRYKLLLKEKGKGTARDNINIGTFEAQRFPFPPLERQQLTVQKLNAIHSETKRLEAIYQQKIAALEELKKAILQKAFRGEFTG